MMQTQRFMIWLLVLILCGLGELSGVDHWRALAQLSPGPLRVGTSGDYAPFSLRGEDGTSHGFDVEIARAYAADRGRVIEFIPFRWPELQARLLKGDFDVAMSGVTVRGDRLAAAPMTRTVARADAVLLIRPGTAGITHDWTALMIGVNRGGHLEQVARARLPQANIVAVDNNLSLPNLLTLGQVDAIVVDALEAAPQFHIAQVLSQDRKAYWVSPKALGLADDLDAWLEARETDGSLNRWREQFLGKPSPSEIDPRLLRVTDLIGRRLMLMPAVAWAKQAAGRAVEDPVREDVVEKSANRAAREAGLDEAAYHTFVRVQFGAAKLVQKAALTAGSSHSGRTPEEGQKELVQVLRPAIDRIDRAILGELARLPPIDGPAEALVAALRADAPVPGIDEDVLGRLAEALLRLTKKPKGETRP